MPSSPTKPFPAGAGHAAVAFLMEGNGELEESNKLRTAASRPEAGEVLDFATLEDDLLRNENAALSVENETMAGEMEALRGENAALKLENEGLRTQNAELRRSLLGEQDASPRAEDEHADLLMKSQEERSSMASRGEAFVENESLRNEIELLKSEVQALRGESAELEALRSEAQALRSEVKALRIENAELRVPLDFEAGMAWPGSPGSRARKKSPGDLDFSPLVGGRRMCPIPAIEERGIFPSQLRSLLDFLALHTSAGSWPIADGEDDVLMGWQDPSGGFEMRISTINLYQLVDWVIRPSTDAQRCSFVEVMAQDPSIQKPSWFVSHWWGEPVADFVQCVEGHRRLRHLPERTGYWVCAYAHSQWELEAEMQEDPSVSSFSKAMAACAGVISILDREAMCFGRVWCCYEVHVMLLGPQEQLFDLATISPTGGAAILSSGITAHDKDPQWQHLGGPSAVKAAREKHFPLDIMAKGLSVCLEQGEATNEGDRRRVLNSVAGREDLDVEPPVRSDAYDEVNRALRWRFAVCCLEQAFDVDRLGELGLADIQPPDESSVKSCELMADAFHKEGRYGLALEFYKKALTGSFQALNRRHSVFSDEEGEHDKAAAFNKRALSIQQSALRPEYEDQRTVYNSMAKVDSEAEVGHREKALAFYENALGIRLEVMGRGHPDICQAYNGMAYVYHSKGRNDRALEFYNKALDMKAVLGKDHLDLASTYHGMACVYVSKDLNKKALEFYKKALTIRLKALGPHHLDVGLTYYNMAGAYCKHAWMPQALECYQKALAIRLKKLEPDHPHVGATYWGMAGICMKQAHHKEALDFYQKALAIQQKALGPEHPHVATLINNVAVAHVSLGQRQEGLESYERALAIRLKVMGEDHPHVGQAYYNIAIVYADMGENDKALEHYEKALDIQENALGPDHPDVGVCFNNMAVIYMSQGKKDQALELYEKAVAIQLATLGPEHEDAGKACHTLATLYGQQGRLEKALQFYEKALSIRLEALGPEHEDVGRTYNGIGIVCMEQGQRWKALEHYEMALAVQLKALGPEHLFVGTVYCNMALVYVSLRQNDKALDLYKKAVAIRLKVLGSEHPDVCSIWDFMGRIYNDDGKKDKALEFHEKALSTRLKMFGPEHADVGQSYHGTAHVYVKSGQLEKALDFYKKALAIRLEKLDAEHLDIGKSYYCLAGVHEKQGEIGQAIEHYEKAQGVFWACYGLGHPETIDAQVKANTLRAQQLPRNSSGAHAAAAQAAQHVQRADAARKRVVGFKRGFTQRQE